MKIFHTTILIILSLLSISALIIACLAYTKNKDGSSGLDLLDTALPPLDFGGGSYYVVKAEGRPSRASPAEVGNNGDCLGGGFTHNWSADFCAYPGGGGTDDDGKVLISGNGIPAANGGWPYQIKDISDGECWKPWDVDYSNLQMWSADYCGWSDGTSQTSGDFKILRVPDEWTEENQVVYITGGHRTAAAAKDLNVAKYSLHPTTEPTHGSGKCIANSQLIDTKTKGLITIKDLKPGDYVHNGEYYDLVYFIQEHEGEFEVLNIHLGDDILKLTSEHLVYLGNQMICAGSLNTGDKIQGQTIKNITTTVESVRNPMTISGKLLLGEIVASCYTRSEEHAKKLQKLADCFDFEKLTEEIGSDMLQELVNTMYNKLANETFRIMKPLPQMITV